MKSLLREPLVHFLLIGAALFVVFGLFDQRIGLFTAESDARENSRPAARTEESGDQGNTAWHQESPPHGRLG